METKTRANEVRGLLKRCFKISTFSFVPFEIWRDIVNEAEPTAIVRLSQTCRGFKDLVNILRELLLEYAFKYRREEKIEKAKDLIMRCADIGNSRALFLITQANELGGWGIQSESITTDFLFKKLIVSRNLVGFAYFGYSPVFYDQVLDIDVLKKKAFESENFFAVGLCHFRGYATPISYEKAAKYFKLSAEEVVYLSSHFYKGDEFGQRWLGMCFEEGVGVVADKEKAFYWFKKSAEQGHAESQYKVGKFLMYGRGCEVNKELANLWVRKAERQGFTPGLFDGLLDLFD